MIPFRSNRFRSGLYFLFLWVFVVSAYPAYAGGSGPSPDIVISQVYGGGGTLGAIYTNDFIELFNRGSAAVDITGWSVQYASATGSFWQVTPLNGTVQPGQYYLVQGAGGGTGAPLPPPDATGSLSLSSTAGKVALATSTTALSCGSNCATAAAVRDYVGYGDTANNYEGGGPAPAPSATTAVLRAGNGCTDTDENGIDFSAGTPVPRNSATSPNICTCGITLYGSGINGGSVNGAGLSATWNGVTLNGTTQVFQAVGSGPFTITASSGNYDALVSWSGDCDSMIGNGTLSAVCIIGIMNAGKNITATFSASPNFVNIFGAANTLRGSYPTVTQAIEAAALNADDLFISLRERLFDEPVVYDRQYSVILEGGNNATFTDNTGTYSTINSLQISDGALQIENIEIR